MLYLSIAVMSVLMCCAKGSSSSPPSCVKDCQDAKLSEAALGNCIGSCIKVNTNCLDFQIVDMTHEQSAKTIYWPGNPEYNFTILTRGRTSLGFWLETNYFGTAEHGGTHLDAPAHFYQDRWRTQDIPLENLVGPGVVIDVKNKVLQNPDYRVSVADLEQWENLYGRIPDKAIVMMNSGWDKRYPNPSLVFNTAHPTDPSTFHFPGWHENAVSWLINHRSVNVIGVDTPSTDYGRSTTFPVHVLLGSAYKSGVEHVANLDMLPNSGSIIYVAVMKIKDGSGGPARVFATIPKSKSYGY